MKRNNFDLGFSMPFLLQQDAEPIICALDLVVSIPADTPEQERLNRFNCNVVVQKLRSGNLVFTLNEWRVIGAGIGIAMDLLSGVGSRYISFDELDPEWRDELRRYFLVYNRLYPHIKDLFQTIDEALSEPPAPNSH